MYFVTQIKVHHCWTLIMSFVCENNFANYVAILLLLHEYCHDRGFLMDCIAQYF